MALLFCSFRPSRSRAAILDAADVGDCFSNFSYGSRGWVKRRSNSIMDIRYMKTRSALASCRGLLDLSRYHLKVAPLFLLGLALLPVPYCVAKDLPAQE
jgi:hypothetical protein